MAGASQQPAVYPKAALGSASDVRPGDSNARAQALQVLPLPLSDEFCAEA